ncbi:MAG: hypothetical protein SGILL_007761 [Bacillariaceae sp.]
MTTPPFSLSNLSADLTLQIVKFLNVKDSGRLAATCQRQFYLVQQYREQRGAELVVAANGDTEATIPSERFNSEKVIQKCVASLQSRPNLALSFTSHDRALQSSSRCLHEIASIDADKHQAVVLGTVAPAIQNNIAESGGVSSIEHSSTVSTMMAHFPQAKLVPFAIQNRRRSGEVEMQVLERRLQAEDPTTWKAMIVYAGGSGVEVVEQFVSRMQQSMPNASIVGGISGMGYVSRTPWTREFLSGLSIAQLQGFPECVGRQFIEKREMVDCILENASDGPLIVRNGIYGVVLGGAAPVRSMVSRGVKSVFQGKPKPFSNFTVHETKTVEPADDDYLFDGDDANLKPYHLISEIKDTDTNEVMTCTQFFAKSNLRESEFIGIKRDGYDGFELEGLSPYSQQLGAFLIHTDGSERQTETLLNAQLDFFFLDGEACMEDMDETVDKLKEQTQGEEILGALMFSCNGRGPESGYLIPEDMADA